MNDPIPYGHSPHSSAALDHAVRHGNVFGPDLALVCAVDDGPTRLDTAPARRPLARKGMTAAEAPRTGGPA